MSSPTKRPRVPSDTAEWETTTVRSGYSMGSTFAEHCHDQMLHEFDYVAPATSMGTEQQSKNLTCHICGTHSEKKKSVCFYTCRSRTCQKTRDGVDGLSVCGSESCLRVMESFFGFKCPKCSCLCCCVKEAKEWRHKHESTVTCPCKNKRGLADKRGIVSRTPSSSSSDVTQGGAGASVSVDEKPVCDDRLSSVEQQAKSLEERQTQLEHSVGDIANRVSRMQMTNVKFYEGKILERIHKFQDTEKDPNWIHDSAQREQAANRLRHVMQDTDMFIQEMALSRPDSGESNEQKISRTREERCLFGNSPNHVLQWAQAKLRTIEEAQNSNQLPGNQLPEVYDEGSALTDRQPSDFSID